MNSIRPGDDSGVNVLLEYIFSLILTVIVFSMLVTLIGNMSTTSDHIALTGEYRTLSNDMANRISAFSSEISLNTQRGFYDSTVLNNNNFKQTIYFDLPEPVNGKQFRVDITYNQGTGMGTVKVSSTSNTFISWSATFPSKITVKSTTFYSQAGRYEIVYDPTSATPISVEGSAI